MFLKVAPDATVLLGDYDPHTDPENARILAQNAALLQVTTNVAGRHFRVVRVPMLENRDGMFRTYLNGLVVNDIVLLPTYRDYPVEERAAAAAHRLAFPGRQVIGLVADEIIRRGGAIHCATRAQPVHRRTR
jgi:agmatine deiminase